jgi:hypothetical protein
MNPPVEGQDEVLDAGAVLADPSASHWLKQSIESALQRDPVDALNDALVLAAVLDGHLRDALELTDPA